MKHDNKQLTELARMALENGCAGFPKLQHFEFVPYRKGDYIYTAEIHDMYDRFIVEICRKEIIATWSAGQTRHFRAGDLLVIGESGIEHNVPVREAYPNLKDLLLSLSNVICRSNLRYIEFVISTHPNFMKIRPFCLCVQFDANSGESPVKNEVE